METRHFFRSSFITDHSSFILSAAIFSITFITFSRLITCDFTWWDDQATISENTRLNPPAWSTLTYYWTTAGEHETMGLYIPITYTVWTTLAHFARLNQPDALGLTLDAKVFHTANVVIHSITAVVVFHLLLRLFANASAAMLGALLYALHPVQVESVGWVSGTKDLLCGLFSVSALLMYVRSRQFASNHPHQQWPAHWRYGVGVLLFILAMLSKPTGVVVPLMAAAIGIFLLNIAIRKAILSLLPWFVLMIPCLIWTQKVQPASWASPLPMWARPAVAADAIAFYFCKLVWPVHLGIDYGHNPASITADHTIYFTWLMPVAVGAILWRKYKKHRAAVAAALLFVLPLGPILGLVPFEFELISTTSDHYMYLSMAGAALLLAWAITRYRFPKWVAGCVLIALAIRTRLQEPVWQDTRTLFNHALAVNPISIPSFDGLGYITGRDARRLSTAGHQAEARPLFDQSIAWYRKSLIYDVNSIPSMLNLALDYQAIGRTDLGLAQIHRMEEIQPQLPEGLKADPITLAHLLNDFGDLPGTIHFLDDLLQHDPGNVQAAVLRERALQRLKMH